MNKAKSVKQIIVTTKNEVGKFAEVATAVAEANVNLRALCAWGEADKAVFAMVTDNNEKAKRALAPKGWKVDEKDAVCILLDDRIGAAADIAKTIKNAGIDLQYAYGTSCACEGATALLILVSKENEKILEALNA